MRQAVTREEWLKYEPINEYDEYLISPFGVERTLKNYFRSGSENSKDRLGIYLSLIDSIEKKFIEGFEGYIEDRYWLCIGTKFDSSYFTIWRYNLEITRDSDYMWLLDKWENYKKKINGL